MEFTNLYLEFIKNNDIIELLKMLNDGALKNVDNETALFYSLSIKNYSIARFLISNYNKLNIRLSKFVIECANTGDESLIDFIGQYIDLEDYLLKIIKSSCNKISKHLLNKLNYDLELIFYIAVKVNNEEIVSFLIKKKKVETKVLLASIRYCNKNKLYNLALTLMKTVKLDSKTTEACIQYGNAEIVKYLIDYNTNFNVFKYLLIACSIENEEIVSYLLNTGISIPSEIVNKIECVNEKILLMIEKSCKSSSSNKLFRSRFAFVL